MWLVGRDRASSFVLEDGPFAAAARADVVVVEQLVVAGAEQDEIVELGPAAMLAAIEVVRFELALSSAAGVLAVPVRALVQRPLLRVGGAAPDARMHEVASAAA